MTGEPAGGAAEVAAAARDGEPDRYLAALLAPNQQREALLALAAFATELARIPHRAAREPLMGEIRLQWWRDALGLAEGESTGHSVADAVRKAVRRYGLPAAAFDAMIEARALELHAVPFADDSALQDYLQNTEGVLFALACRVIGLDLGPDPSPGSKAACTAAGQAYGLARLLLGLPRSSALGRIPLARTQVATAGLTEAELLAGEAGPRAERLLQAYFAQIRANLAEARRLVHILPRDARVAFLPLALVEPYVRALERQGGGALREEAQIVPLARVWKITAAHLFGRL